LDADGGCDSAVTARVRSAWKEFGEYCSNWKRILVKTERQGICYLYEVFVLEHRTIPLEIRCTIYA